MSPWPWSLGVVVAHGRWVVSSHFRLRVNSFPLSFESSVVLCLSFVVFSFLLLVLDAGARGSAAGAQECSRSRDAGVLRCVWASRSLGRFVTLAWSVLLFATSFWKIHEHVPSRLAT